MAALAKPAGASVTSISNLRDVRFGSMAGDADLAGTASMPSGSNSKTVAGGVFDLGGTVARGRFRLNGPGSSAYSCTFPSSIQISSGGDTISFDNIVANKALSGNLSGQGRKNIRIGGTLQISAGQAAGSYTGNLTLDCGTVNATIAVTATLGAAISISNSSSLEFGKMEPTGVPGTVTISTSGTRTSSNVNLWPSSVSAASFNVSGEGNESYTVTLPSSATLTSGGNTMTVDTFTHDAGGSPSLSGGSANFNVGATQTAGAYTGTFAVTVGYN